MKQKTSSFFNYLLVFVFAGLSVLGIAHHPMWLDEVNCWLMIKSSHSIKELHAMDYYNGSLSIWEYLLYGLSRFTENIVYVQVLNIIISILAACLFVKYSPFSFAQKICILFSYFFLFEYTLISRSYALTWLFLVIFCILFTQKRRNYLAIILSLLFLSNTHFFSFITAIPLFLVAFYFMRIKDKINYSMLVLLCLIFIAGMTVTLFNMMPSKNATVFLIKDPYFSSDHISKSLSYFVKGLYPLPDFMSSHFWNSNFIVVHIKPLSILLTAFILIMPYFIFSEKYLILLFFYITNFAIIAALFALKLIVGTRYMGYCFMLLLVSLWLATDERFYQEPKLIKKWLPARSTKARLIITPFLWSIFIVQLLSGICTFAIALHKPFSEGKNVADYIKSNLPTHSNVIVAPTPSGPSVSAYLNTALYYPQSNDISTFYKWTKLPDINNKQLIQKIFTHIDNDSSRYATIIISSGTDSFPGIYQLIESKIATGHYSIYKQVLMNDGMVESENYMVYLLRKN